jgi:DMSO/TMAO reductase YedYZ molybdopterin-dependent catalytic subunit
VDGASERRYGRATFLLLVGGGLSSLAWGAKASGVFSPLTSSVSQLVGNLFPVGGWRIYTISGSMPVFDPKTWRLEIGGLVAKPRSFTYDELRALPQSHQVSDFHCVTGWTVHGVRWSGVRFSHLLEQVQPLPEAKAIRFVSLEEPYDDSLTLEQLHLRDVIPEMYGYKGVKWLSRIELVDHQPTGYWEGLGYDQNAWVGRSNGYSSA